MTATITSQLSVHGTTEIEAWRYPEMEAFRIMFGCGDYFRGQTEVVVHLDQAGLAEKIVKAINDCVAAHKASLAQVTCEKCHGPCTNPENEYGEFVCDNCLQNAAERAWERHCEAFHDGGATQFNSLTQQQIEARRRLK